MSNYYITVEDSKSGVGFVLSFEDFQPGIAKEILERISTLLRSKRYAVKVLTDIEEHDNDNDNCKKDKVEIHHEMRISIEGGAVNLDMCSAKETEKLKKELLQAVEDSQPPKVITFGLYK
ncbi:hypothetical protein COEREDRAFT_89256 [Coemansia reversa NRRL 1564]|uniref:Uncharacterized protein n=1 Tax=Coemansia reversa (strain ATCC 12441 / NRRL 1564) TaxID=763665 RepID=A0A2G5B4A4_COERN|nr:hypothetical protein COEREDRAFT_89256 [Coemansia reversa NRRL 1564]|eukprot:PIA13832.1 hypothetical protein COEREDRAFT_89256 [Coemansia reversa NRRL 1564]